MSETPTDKTPLYDEHVRAGGRMVPFAGFSLPIQYSGIVDEHNAVRTAAGIFDVSHMGELEMRGEYAAQVVDYLVTNDTRKLVDGQALYTCACNAEGTILDDLIVYRAAQDRWLEVSSVSNFESFQANRLKLRYKEDKTNKLAHTLNGSALALPRIVAALLENNQQPDGISIPAPLVPYTGFAKID